MGVRPCVPGVRAFFHREKRKSQTDGFNGEGVCGEGKKVTQAVFTINSKM